MQALITILLAGSGYHPKVDLVLYYLIDFLDRGRIRRERAQRRLTRNRKRVEHLDAFIYREQMRRWVSAELQMAWEHARRVRGA